MEQIAVAGPEELIGRLPEPELKTAPPLLYVRGDPALIEFGPRVAVVGSRRASPARLALLALLAGCVADAAAPAVDATVIGTVQEAEVGDTAGVLTFTTVPLRFTIKYRYDHPEHPTPPWDKKAVGNAVAVWEEILRDTRLAPSPECETAPGEIVVEVVSLWDLFRSGTVVLGVKGMADIDCIGKDGLPRHMLVALENVPPPENDREAWEFLRYEIFMHEIGHGLGIGSLTASDGRMGPHRLVDCSSENCRLQFRYECHYLTYGGESRFSPVHGLRARSASAQAQGYRDYSLAIEAYREAGGILDDVVPVAGNGAHLHSSLTQAWIPGRGGTTTVALMSYGSGSSNVNGVRQPRAVTTVTLGILASIGWSVDMSLAYRTALAPWHIEDPITWWKNAHPHSWVYAEDRLCRSFAADDGEFNPLGRVAVFVTEQGDERVFPTRLVRNW